METQRTTSVWHSLGFKLYGGIQSNNRDESFIYYGINHDWDMFLGDLIHSCYGIWWAWIHGDWSWDWWCFLPGHVYIYIYNNNNNVCTWLKRWYPIVRNFLLLIQSHANCWGGPLLWDFSIFFSILIFSKCFNFIFWKNYFFYFCLFLILF